MEVHESILPGMVASLHLTVARLPYTSTSHLHLQNTHATDVRILVYSFPPVEEVKAPLPEL